MLSQIFGLFRSDFAVDLGTANTLIGIPGEGVVLNEPSVVAVEQGKKRILSGGCAVGHLARQMLGRTPSSIAVLHPLRHGVIADFELCESMLRYFLRKARRHAWGLRPRVLIGVPGGITPVEKQAVYNSALRAGAGQVLLISQARAAAIGVGLPITEPLASMICDIGGGTTEVAVLSMGDIVAAESIRIGGEAMDRAIIDYLRRHYSLRIGLPGAERLRIDLGSAYPLAREQTDEIGGLDTVSGTPRKVLVTSEEVREALSEPLQSIAEAIKSTVDRCGPDLGADLVRHGLVLAGGAALLPGLDRYLEEQTGIRARVSPDATCAVAQGCLVCLERLDAWRGMLESSDDDS